MGGLLDESYSTGNVSATYVGSPVDVYGIAGFVGRSYYSRAKSCFWDTTTSRTTLGVGEGEDEGIEGRTTAEMMKKRTFEDAGWDFEERWCMVDGKSYPVHAHYYQPPVVEIDNPGSVLEDDPVTVSYEVAVDDYPPGNGLDRVGFETDASSWLTWHEASRTITGTPTNANLGKYWLNVSVVDLLGTRVWNNVTLEVVNVNDPPEIVTEDVVVATEDEAYTVFYRATDVDPTRDRLSWELTTEAEWLTMDARTGVLMGTPTNDHVGEHLVTINVTDGNGGEAGTEFTLTVVNTNDPPVITTEDVMTATEDEPFSVDYDATDEDPTEDELVWRLESAAPWLHIDEATGVLSGTPTNDDVGSYQVTLRVLDGRGGVDKTTFMLTVENTNDAPVISTTPVDEVDEDGMYTLFLEATDEDPTRDTFTWSLVTDAEWLELDGNRLHGVPTNDDVGEHVVNITVDDGNGGQDSVEFTLTVINTNDPPAILGTPSNAWEDQAYSFIMEATDEDVGDTMEWSVEPSEGWIAIDPSTGELTGTPTDDDVGTLFVMIVVTDGVSWVSKGFSITVSETNDVPEWVTVPKDTTLEEGWSLVHQVVAMDQDGDGLTYSIASEPAAEGLTIGLLSGEIVWYDVQEGTYVLTVTASDGEEEIVTSYNLTVEAPPKVESVDNTPLYAVIGVLVAVVVLLLLWQMMGRGKEPVSAEEDYGAEPVEDVEVEGSDDLEEMSEEG
jgi:hypothetical protein